MSFDMTDSWVEVMGLLAEDPGLAAVVVTGQGRAFCAGGDLSWLGGGEDESVELLERRMHRFYSDWLRIQDVPVPTIAAINGAAIGAGLALAMGCDLRIATPQARLAVPFTHLGLHPGMATTWSLPRAVSPALAADMLLTGRALTGQEALAEGLVSRIAEPDDVVSVALDMARQIATAGPIASRLTVQTLRAGHRDMASAISREALAQATTMATQDVHEGLAAVADKRAPRFTGR